MSIIVDHCMFTSYSIGLDDHSTMDANMMQGVVDNWNWWCGDGDDSNKDRFKWDND